MGRTWFYVASVTFLFLLVVGLNGMPLQATGTAAVESWTLKDGVDDNTVYSNLMALYDSTEGNNWSQRWNWGNTSVSYCRWYGVCCNGVLARSNSCPLPNWEVGNFSGSCCDSSGNLTSISLVDNNLVGQIPSEVGNLLTLRSILLFENQLSGTIPASFQQLVNLQRLALFGNALTGTIPAFLGDLSELVSIRIYSNPLEGSIPPNLGKLRKLKYLVLRANQLSGTIPPEISNISSLEELVLADNMLQGSIPSSFGLLTQLRILYLFSNQLSGTIPPEISQLQKLVNIALYSNKLTGAIPENIGSTTATVGIYLGGNQLSGTIPSSIGELASLQVFSAHDNMLSGTLPDAFAHSSSIREIILRFNQLTGGIPPEFGSYTPILEVLDLGFNRLTGPIPRPLFRLQQLQILAFPGNELSDVFEPTAPFDFTWCTPTGFSLNQLDLSSNSFSGSLSFFQYFAQMTQLSVRKNKFEGAIDLPLTAALGNASFCTFLAGGKVTDLDLSENRFTSIVQVPNTLNALRAPKNNLQSGMDALSGLIACFLLDLQDNPKLQGDFPQAIVTSRALRYLFCDNTQIKSKYGSQLPPGWTFSATVENSFYSSSTNWIACPAVTSINAPNAFLSFNPAYFEFSTCFCGAGYAGRGPLCTECPRGTYNEDASQTYCKECPARSYSNNEASLSCTTCAPPLYWANQDKTQCLAVWPFYLAGLGLFVVVGIPLILVLAVAIIVGSGYAGTVIFDQYNRMKVAQATRLVEQRAREEIPADLLIPYSDLKIHSIIGHGSFARVSIGTWKNCKVAIKELTGRTLHRLSSDPVDTQADKSTAELVEKFRSEVRVLSQLHHPNIIILLGACTEYPNLCIVTEYAPSGSLNDVLRQKNNNLEWQITTDLQMLWLLETASGMSYLHGQGIMHRDLKSHNVLVCTEQHLKLCDFGMARTNNEIEAARTMTQGVGSLLWMAPEVLLQQDYSFSADVFSWAIVAWEIMSPGQVVHAGKSAFQVSQSVVQGDRPPLQPSWPAGVHVLLSRAWQSDPLRRPSFEEIVLQIAPLVKDMAHFDSERSLSDARSSTSHPPFSIGDDSLETPLLLID